MLIKNESLYILLILSLIIFTKGQKENEKEKLETCNSQENPEYKILYDNYFLNQPKSSYNNFEFDLNQDIIDYLKTNDMISYPKKLFRGKHQGNFLHFMHLIYEKSLPLYFSVDQIIYPYIEITKEIIEKIIEQGIYDIFYNFLNDIIEYGRKHNQDEKIMTYFLIGFKFLVKEKKVENDEIIKNIIDNILNIDNINNDINKYYNFTLLGYERSINKLNFIKIHSLFNNTNLNSTNLFYCITFFQNFIFNIKNELYTIYSIGKIIYKSGQAQIYKQLKIFFKYIFNEEENIMNPLEIYEYININFPNKNKTKEEINFNLYYKMKEKMIENSALSFVSNYNIFNEKYKYEFINQKNNKISLFSYPYNIEQWINYKLININKKRFFSSLYEFITIVHNGNKMKNLIMNRYHYGKNKNSTSNKKKLNQKMIKFRDSVDMENEFNETKKLIDKSLNEEYMKWENSYENSLNYLLNIIGHSNNGKYLENKNEKNVYESKIFSTLIGSYIHFKKDIFLFEQTTTIHYAQNGTFIDIYFEDNIKFYEELNKITLIFQNYTSNIINYLKNSEIKKNLTNYIQYQLSGLFNAYKNIIKMIYYQSNNIYNKEREKIVKSIFYYDNKTKKYEGWYVDLYKKYDKQDINYSLNIYAYNYFISEPLNELNYTGSIIYGAMNYPEFGLIAIDDKINKTKKIYIMSFYSGNEYPHGWSDEIDFNSLKRLIINR